MKKLKKREELVKKRIISGLLIMIIIACWTIVGVKLNSVVNRPNKVGVTTVSGEMSAGIGVPETTCFGQGGCADKVCGIGSAGRCISNEETGECYCEPGVNNTITETKAPLTADNGVAETTCFGQGGCADKVCGIGSAGQCVSDVTTGECYCEPVQ